MWVGACAELEKILKKYVWMVWPIKRLNMGINLRKCCLLSRGWLGGATDQWLQLPRLWSRLPQVFPRRERENWQPGSAKRIYQQCQNHPKSSWPSPIGFPSTDLVNFPQICGGLGEDPKPSDYGSTTGVPIAKIRPSISAVAGQDDCPQRSIYAYRYRSR